VADFDGTYMANREKTRRGRVSTAMALHATSKRRDRVWTGGLVLCE
jgi:hypothetical protein